MKFTQAQNMALLLAHKGGGFLVKHLGGHWAEPDFAGPQFWGCHRNYVTTATINALVKKGVAEHRTAMLTATDCSIVKVWIDVDKHTNVMHL